MNAKAPVLSKADQRRARWMRKHKGKMIVYSRQLTRRPPRTYETVYGVDWISHDQANTWLSCDGAQRTKRLAIDAAVRREAEHVTVSRQA